MNNISTQASPSVPLLIPTPDLALTPNPKIAKRAIRRKIVEIQETATRPIRWREMSIGSVRKWKRVEGAYP